MLRWKAPISTDHVIFDYTISWQMNAAYGNFYKSSKAWNLIEKTEYKKVYFHKLYNKCCIIKQIKAITWLCFFCPVWLIRERLNSFQVLSFHLFFFLIKKRGGPRNLSLQIISHKFQSISVDDIRKHKFKENYNKIINLLKFIVICHIS